MKFVLWLLVGFASSSSAWADAAREAVCLQGYNEQKPMLSPKLELSEAEQKDVLALCANSTSIYWFSTAMYLEARNAGDTHATALKEYALFGTKPNLVFTIPDYIYFRVVLHSTNQPYLLRLQAFQDILAVRQRYRFYPQ